MRRLSPQEKKRLSYERDCRYCYGESPHAARKGIPLRKALENRARRRRTDHHARQVAAQPDGPSADRAEVRLHAFRQRWTKVADIPLREAIEEQHRYRAWIRERGGRRARLKKTQDKAS